MLGLTKIGQPSNYIWIGNLKNRFQSKFFTNSPMHGSSSCNRIGRIFNEAFRRTTDMHLLILCTQSTKTFLRPTCESETVQNRGGQGLFKTDISIYGRGSLHGVRHTMRSKPAVLVRFSPKPNRY